MQTLTRDGLFVVVARSDVDRAACCDAINAALNRREGVVADGSGRACAVRVGTEGAGEIVVDIDGGWRCVVVLDGQRGWIGRADYSAARRSGAGEIHVLGRLGGTVD